MGIKKEKAIAELHKNFETYSGLVLRQLKLLETILEADSFSQADKFFGEIKEQEKRINSFDVQISEEVINIIVLYNPVATELRRMMAINRSSLNLEKIGDLVTNIVKQIKKIEEQKLGINISDSLGNMHMISASMVEKALNALRNNDMDYAVWTIKNDDIVDQLHKSIIKKIIKTRMPHVKNQAELKTFIHLMNIAKNLERIADSATNIAESAIYSVMGKDVRHKKYNIDSLFEQHSSLQKLPKNNSSDANSKDIGS